MKSPGPTFISALAAGDVLGCDALMELAVSTGMVRDAADFFYTDERRISPVTKMMDAYFKPGWSPDLLLSTNYVGRLWLAHSDLLERSAVTVEDWLDKGDYDLVLRTTEQAKSVHHIPKVLCERAAGAAEASALEKVALERTLQREGREGQSQKGMRRGHLSGEAQEDHRRIGLDHHPHLRRGRASQNVPGDAQGEDRLPQFRDHLHRKYPR